MPQEHKTPGESELMHAEEWLRQNSTREPEEIDKVTHETRAWFCCIDGQETFVKLYPSTLIDSWASIEAAIAGGGLHNAIVPLRGSVACLDGMLFLYDRVRGQALDLKDTRNRFAALPTAARAAAVLTIVAALAAVSDAGFVVVDWYDGNMLYDFEAGQIWLFDWELCREGGSFVLEMDSNYGSSKLQAPEEFVRGSRLDQTTLVFNLGRYALLNLPELAVPLAGALSRATYPAQSGRYRSVREFYAALSDSLSV